MLAGSRHFFVHVILFGFDEHRVEVLTLRALECLEVVAGIIPLDSDKPGLRPAFGAEGNQSVCLPQGLRCGRSATGLSVISARRCG